jgi:hypothetical protein
MGQIRLDKKEEKPVDISELKNNFNNVQTLVRTLNNAHKFMKPKEKAQKIQEIQNALKVLDRLVEKFRSAPFNNTGVKFGFESFKASFTSFLPRWKKLEAELLGETE